jgi:hypothetical protein
MTCDIGASFRLAPCRMVRSQTVWRGSTFLGDHSRGAWLSALAQGLRSAFVCAILGSRAWARRECKHRLLGTVEPARCRRGVRNTFPNAGTRDHGQRGERIPTPGQPPPRLIPLQHCDSAHHGAIAYLPSQVIREEDVPPGRAPFLALVVFSRQVLVQALASLNVGRIFRPRLAKRPGACPNCGETWIERCGRKGLVEAIFCPLVKRWPYRCRICDLRFFSPERVHRSRHCEHMTGQPPAL